MTNRNMLVENIILKKLGTARAAWFKNSQSFLLLEEPAFMVFDLFNKNYETEKIVEICRQKYGHLEKNIPQFVHEIIQQIEYFNNPENKTTVSFEISDNPVETVPKLIQKTYRVNGVLFQIGFQNHYLEFAIHPQLRHLLSENQKNVNNCIQLIENNESWFLALNGKVVDGFNKSRFNYFTGSASQLIYSVLYNRGYFDWMAMLHASGVIKNNRAILFSAQGGKGKSTLAALLKAKGFGYLSDDLVAADEKGMVYPYPSAISVKQGALNTLLPYYPELNNTKAENTKAGKRVRYIPPNNREEISEAPYPVHAFVFVHFSKKNSFKFEELEKKEALKMLLEETWVKPEPQNVKHFFNWIESTPFFRLRYADFRNALEVMNKL